MHENFPLRKCELCYVGFYTSHSFLQKASLDPSRETPIIIILVLPLFSWGRFLKKIKGYLNNIFFYLVFDVLVYLNPGIVPFK